MTTVKINKENNTFGDMLIGNACMVAHYEDEDNLTVLVVSDNKSDRHFLEFKGLVLDEESQYFMEVIDIPTDTEIVFVYDDVDIEVYKNL